MRRHLFRTLLAGLAAGLLAPPPADAQVAVSLNWLGPAETVYISDFNPYGTGQQPDLIGINIQNGAARTQNIVIELSVRMDAPRSLLIFRGRTDPFELSEAMLRLTNRDLASRGQAASIRDFEIGRQAEEMGDRLTQTGRFPAGTYVFEVEVRTPQGVVLDRGQVTRQLTNPTLIELSSPGVPFGQPPPALNTPSPRFLWSSDGGIVAGEGQYRLRVVEVQDAASAEEAMQDFASWETETTATTALYPGSADALALVPGATYAWQVIREVRTSGGIEEIQSEIYTFRMSNALAGGSAGATPDQHLVVERIRLLADRLGLGEEFRNFRPAGPVFVDGESITLEQLARLLQAMLDGDLPFQSITVR